MKSFRLSLLSFRGGGRLSFNGTFLSLGVWSGESMHMDVRIVLLGVAPVGVRVGQKRSSKQLSQSVSARK